MLDTREGTHHHHHHHHMSHHHLHAKPGAGSAVVERPTTPQQPHSGASPRQAASSSPSLSHVMEEDDFIARRGEKKGRVKHVGRGRKRLLDPDTLDYSSDYTTTAATPTSTSTTPTMTTAITYQPAAHSAPPAKRARTSTSDEEQEEEVVEAPRRTVSEERQSTGCTDEDYVYRPRSVKEEVEVEEEEESQVEEEDESKEEEEQEQVECFEVPHPAPRTWVAKAEWALGQLGGRGTLADIYAAIEEAFPEEIEGKRNWKAAIRSCLSKNEKNKFYKPHPPVGTAKSDHVWCLASAASANNNRLQRRSRPAGRTRSSSATTSSAAQVSRQPRSGRRRSLPPIEAKEAEEKKQEPVELVERQDDGRRDEESRDNEEADLRQLEYLLRQKQELEQDISRLEEEEKEQGADGLSTEQEAFLSQILG